MVKVLSAEAEGPAIGPPALAEKTRWEDKPVILALEGVWGFLEAHCKLVWLTWQASGSVEDSTFNEVKSN